MQVTLVDKNYRHNPHDLSQTIVAKVEIICGTETELMNILSYIASMDADLIPKVSTSNSGVQSKPEPKAEEPVALEKPEPEESEEVVENSPLGPISSLEIE